MKEYGLSLADVNKTIKAGAVIDVSQDKTHPEDERWTVQGRSGDGRLMNAIVVAVEDALFIEVITVIDKSVQKSGRPTG